jgi:uncharacterized Zn finger protein
MKRTIDKLYNTYSVYTTSKTGINVKCPKCKGLGVVTADYYNAYFRCTVCFASKTKEFANYRYDVHNQCKECGRYYRVDITDKDKRHFKCLNVACPHCGYVMPGKVQKKEKVYGREIKNG